MAPPTTQGGQSSPPVATLPPPAGPAARRVVCPDHVGCHASRSMRRRIWRNNGPCQVAFRELQREIPRVPDQPRAGLEQPLLKACEGPVLNGDGEHEPAQQVAEVVGDDPEQQTDLIGPEPVTREPGP